MAQLKQPSASGEFNHHSRGAHGHDADGLTLRNADRVGTSPHIPVDASNYLENDFEVVLFEERNRLIDEEGYSEAEAEMIIVSQLTHEQLTELSTPVKADFLDSISEYNGSVPQEAILSENFLNVIGRPEQQLIIPHTTADEIQVRLNNAYNATYHESPLAEHFQPMQDDFLGKITGDPLLVNARENWDDLSQDERLEVLERVHELQCESYGIPEVLVTLTDLEGSLGAFNPRDGLRMDNTFVETASFDDVMGVMIHEGRHVVDWKLGVALNHYEDPITIDDPIYFDAVIYHNATYSYVNNDFRSYASNPTEYTARDDSLMRFNVGALGDRHFYQNIDPDMLDNIATYQEHGLLPDDYEMSPDMQYMLDLREQLEDVQLDMRENGMTTENSDEFERLGTLMTEHRDDMRDQGRLASFGEEFSKLNIAEHSLDKLEDAAEQEWLNDRNLHVTLDHGQWLDEVDGFIANGLLPEDYVMSDDMRALLEMSQQTVGAEGLELVDILKNMDDYIATVAEEGRLLDLDVEFDLLTQAEQDYAALLNDGKIEFNTSDVALKGGESTFMDVDIEKESFNPLIGNYSEIALEAEALHGKLQALDVNNINITSVSGSFTSLFEQSNQIENIKEIMQANPSENNIGMYDNSRMAFIGEIDYLKSQNSFESDGISELEFIKNQIQHLPTKAEPTVFNSERLNTVLTKPMDFEPMT